MGVMDTEILHQHSFQRWSCFNLRTGKLLPYITWKREGCVRTGEAGMNSFYLFLLWRYKPTSKIGTVGLGHLVYPLVSLSLVLGVVTNSPGKVMTDDFSGKFLKGIPAPILPPWIASLEEVSSM